MSPALLFKFLSLMSQINWWLSYEVSTWYHSTISSQFDAFSSDFILDFLNIPS